MNAPHFASARLSYADHGAFEDETAFFPQRDIDVIDGSCLVETDQLKVGDGFAEFLDVIEIGLGQLANHLVRAADRGRLPAGLVGGDGQNHLRGDGLPLGNRRVDGQPPERRTRTGRQQRIEPG